MTPLEKHMQLYPGSYRPEEACTSPHNEAWRSWVKKRDELVEQQNVSRVMLANWRETHSGIAKTGKRCA